MMDREMRRAGTTCGGKNALELGGLDETLHDGDERQTTGVGRRRDPQTARRLRPLARRALMTARPPRDFIRTRNPWVRARRTLEAW